LTALYQLQRLVVAAAAPKPGTVSKGDEYAEIYDRARARIALLDSPNSLDEGNSLDEANSLDED
jgi:hypothetical protein